jgi:MYXO-CTERM domain-containing protein
MKTLYKLTLALPLLSSAAFGATLQQLHFDELGPGAPIPVNGLHIGGVLFHFSGGTADYNGSIGTAGSTALVSDPLLVGETGGTLTLTFDNPTSVLRFDIAMESIDVLTDAYSVAIAGDPLFVGGAAPIVLLSEGQFIYPGTVPVKSAVITFSGAAPGFGLDNLSFAQSPEPATSLVAGLALLTLAGVTYRRRRHRR